MFIEIFNNKDIDFVGSTVINNQGIVGQIIYDKSIAEVLLLTDISHVIPIISDNHFCNARGIWKAWSYYLHLQQANLARSYRDWTRILLFWDGRNIS
jgi:cell shape-determining protein MreC